MNETWLLHECVDSSAPKWRLNQAQLETCRLPKDKTLGLDWDKILFPSGVVGSTLMMIASQRSSPILERILEKTDVFSVALRSLNNLGGIGDQPWAVSVLGRICQASTTVSALKTGQSDSDCGQSIQNWRSPPRPRESS